MGGTSDSSINDPTNLVLLCGSGTTGCHGEIESHRERAIEHGWLVPRRDLREPADVPVFTAAGWYMVTPDRLEPADLDPPF